jgi:hypothetical protein
MTNKSQTYVVRWKWKDDDGQSLNNDTVYATTAPRAANKLIKDLSDDYAFVKQSIMIMSIEMQ